MIAGTTPGGRDMEPAVPAPPTLYERFTVTYPSGTVIESFYAGGATLKEVQVAHPMAVVEVVEQEPTRMKVNPMATLLGEIITSKT